MHCAVTTTPRCVRCSQRPHDTAQSTRSVSPTRAPSPSPEWSAQEQAQFLAHSSYNACADDLGSSCQSRRWPRRIARVRRGTPYCRHASVAAGAGVDLRVRARPLLLRADCLCACCTCSLCAVHPKWRPRHWRACMCDCLWRLSICSASLACDPRRLPLPYTNWYCNAKLGLFSSTANSLTPFS